MNRGRLPLQKFDQLLRDSRWADAFLWTETDGMIALGDLGGTSQSFDINDSGVIVG